MKLKADQRNILFLIFNGKKYVKPKIPPLAVGFLLNLTAGSFDMMKNCGIICRRREKP